MEKTEVIEKLRERAAHLRLTAEMFPDLRDNFADAPALVQELVAKQPRDLGLTKDAELLDSIANTLEAGGTATDEMKSGLAKLIETDEDFIWRTEDENETLQARIDDPWPDEEDDPDDLQQEIENNADLVENSKETLALYRATVEVLTG